MHVNRVPGYIQGISQCGPFSGVCDLLFKVQRPDVISMTGCLRGRISIPDYNLPADTIDGEKEVYKISE